MSDLLLSGLPGWIHSGMLIAAPVLWAALGGLCSERSGVINVGLEGMMLTGAFAAAAGAWASGDAWIGLSIGLTAGALMGLLHAWICLYWRANLIVSGMGINLLAYGATGFLLYRIFGTRGNSPEVPKIHAFSGWDIPFLGELLFPLSPLHILLIGLAGVVFYFYHFTRFGLRLRACGEDPHGVESAGIRVNPYRYTGVVLSGILAAGGGAQLSIADISRFSVGMSDGRGFIALAALIAGGWQPGRLVWICLGFGIFTAMGEQLQMVFPHVSSRMFLMLPFVLALVVLAFWANALRAPAALGKTI